MNHNDTQSIALEVRSITSTLNNLEASRERHDIRNNERFDNVDGKIEIIGKDMAASHEFKRQILDDLRDLKDSVKILTAMSNQAKGGWWVVGAMSTVFSIIGSAIALNINKLFKP